MTAEPVPTSRLVAALDQLRKLPLDRILATDIARIADRVLPSPGQENAVDVTAFNSSI